MLQGIQALRAVAALSVVFLHAFECQVKYGRGPAIADVNTGFGVDIFFVISGLIMVLITSRRPSGWPETRAFLRSRLIRVVPPYWLYTTLVVAVAALVPQAFDRFRLDTAHVVQSYLFLPAPNSLGQVLPVLIVGWTLAYEMYFYAVFALLLSLSQRHRLPVLSLLFGGAVAAGTLHSRNVPLWNLVTSPLLLEFLMGAWLGRLSLRGWLPPRWCGALLAAAGFAALFALGDRAAVSEFYRVICFGLPSASVVAGVLAVERSGFQRFPQWLVRIGDTSYSLYLSHILVLPAIGKAWRVLSFERICPDAGLLLVSIAASLAVAEISYRVIEQPSRTLLPRESKTAVPESPQVFRRAA